MNFHFFLRLCKKAILTLILSLVLFRCADDEFLTDSINQLSASDLNTITSGTTGVSDCSSCTYVVPADASVIDGALLGLKPGSVIGLNSSIRYGALKFRNIVGTADNPIIIRNCGGPVVIDGTGKHDAVKTELSKHFRITGGNVDGSYGITITAGHMGLNLGDLSTNFEVDHIKIIKSGFAGIMAKTDPGCNEATWRGNFLMEDIKLHHNYIADTGGEGIYAGNSFFAGMNTPCGVKLPHEIHDIQIYNNVLRNTGWEAIQLGCAMKGASIHGNNIENFGVANVTAQNNGIQIGAGTGGTCYNNLIKKGNGNGLIVLGLGDNVVYNNIIDQAGGYGIFCDERSTTGQGFKFINNTIISPGLDGIRIYAEQVPMNVIINNVIANPGTYSAYSAPRSKDDAFVYRLSDEVKIQMSNNYFTGSTDSLKIANLSLSNYLLQSTSPVIDKGTDVSAFNINSDFYNNGRLSGKACDIGAVEHFRVNSKPLAKAGSDKTITLPVNSVTLTGSATDSDGSIVSYRWEQETGPIASISNANTSTATVSGLIEGTYSFKLTVKDNDGGVGDDFITILVNPATAIPDNKVPVANAGSDVGMVTTGDEPQIVELSGSGRDSDGSVSGYRWQQFDGPPSTIDRPASAAAKANLHGPGTYVFRLAVTDNDGAVSYDDVVIKVIAMPGDTEELLDSREATVPARQSTGRGMF